MPNTLLLKDCVPYSTDVLLLNSQQKAQYLQHLNIAWYMADEERRLVRKFLFTDFSQAMAFANKVAVLADQQWHHPELHIGFKHCSVQIWTHKINDLVESDFIFAAKVDQIFTT